MDPERFLGGSPLSVAIKLILMSIVVGIVLAALGLSPVELVRRVEFLVRRVYDLGFDWVKTLVGYFLVGAVIVIPIWLLGRLISALRKPKA